MQKLKKIPIHQIRAAKNAYEEAESPDASEQRSTVVAKVAQGFETNINIRVVPGHSLADLERVQKVCRPRQGAQRRDAEPLDLPADQVKKFKDIDKAVIKWLAKDPGNMELYLANPAAALDQADVGLDRADLKAIARSHEAVRAATVVGPGVRVADLKAKAFPKGRLGKTEPAKASKSRRGCVKEN